MSSSLSEKQKMLAAQLYRAADPELRTERLRAKRLCHQYNQLGPDDGIQKTALLDSLLGARSGWTCIEPDFWCDYGSNIHLGADFYANHGLIILDVCPVRIGKGCMFGPRVSLLAATHPIDASTRASGLEYGQPITIGDNVWIGGHAVINPGVALGDNVVVASGAVVTRSFGPNVVIGGVPARILKSLGDADTPA